MFCRTLEAGLALSFSFDVPAKTTYFRMNLLLLYLPFMLLFAMDQTAYNYLAVMTRVNP